MAPRRFTGKEDVALMRIIASLQERHVRVLWADVVAELQELGFPERSQKSVRNRHLRRRQALAGGPVHGKNLCRICGRLQKGHVCEVADTVAEPEDCVSDPS